MSHENYKESCDAIFMPLIQKFHHKEVFEQLLKSEENVIDYVVLKDWRIKGEHYIISLLEGYFAAITKPERDSYIPAENKTFYKEHHKIPIYPEILRAEQKKLAMETDYVKNMKRFLEPKEMWKLLEYDQKKEVIKRILKLIKVEESYNDPSSGFKPFFAKRTTKVRKGLKEFPSGGCPKIRLDVSEDKPYSVDCFWQYCDFVIGPLALYYFDEYERSLSLSNKIINWLGSFLNKYTESTEKAMDQHKNTLNTIF